MTDTIAFFNTVVGVTRQFVNVMEDLQSISDRIGSDSSLSTNAADAASRAGRTELTAADFDNLKIVIDLLITLLAKTNGTDVPVSINTGGSVKLGFYKIV